MKKQGLLGVALATVVAMTLLPLLAGSASAEVAPIAPKPEGAATTGDVFKALGFDTTATPEGYDPNSTDNPYGRNQFTANEVFEPFFLDNSFSRSAIYGDGWPIASLNTIGWPSLPFTNAPQGFGFVQGQSLVAGDFDGDGLAGEIFSAYVNEDTTARSLNFRLLDGQAKSGNPRSVSADTTLSLTPPASLTTDEWQNVLRTTAGDFDGDGSSEVALYIPENGNARVEVWKYLKTSGAGDDAWLDSANWARVWTRPVGSRWQAPNMVSVCAGDFDRDGIDDLAMSYGALEYSSVINESTYAQSLAVIAGSTVPSKAVVLYGSRSSMLQAGDDLSLGEDPVVRAAFGYGDVDADGVSELVMGAQPSSDTTANLQRVVGVYRYDGTSLALESATTNVVDGEMVGGKWQSRNGFDGAYLSQPLMLCNVAITTPRTGDSTYVYLDSVLYSYENNAFGIYAQLDDTDVYGDGKGDPQSLRWSHMYEMGTTMKYPYREWDGRAADVQGEGADVFLSNFSSIARDASNARQVFNDIKTLYSEDGVLESSESYERNFYTGPKSLRIASCFPNTDNDTTLMRYTGKHYVGYSDPKVLGVMASAPYFQDVAKAPDNFYYLDDLETVFGSSTGDGGSTIKVREVGVGLWKEAEWGEGGKFRLGGSAGYTYDYEYEKTHMKEYEVVFATPGGEDAVAFYSVPTEFWEYEVLEPRDDGSYTSRRTTISMPHTAAVQVLGLDYYEKIRPDYPELPQIRGTVLRHTLGDPSTYPKTPTGPVLAQYIGDWAGTSFGYGQITQQVQVTTEESEKTTHGFALSFEAGYGAEVLGDQVLQGFYLNVDHGWGTAELSTKGKSYSGTVKNMPPAEAPYGYYFAWKLFVGEGKTPDGQTFPVVNYLVKDVQAPPKVGVDFRQDHEKTTDTTIGLTWTCDSSASGFNVYRYLDFPEGGGSYLVGYVDASKYTPRYGADKKLHKTYSFTEGGLSEYTSYEYQIQTVRAGRLSTASPVLKARTKTSQGYPRVSIAPTQLTVYPDKNAYLNASVDSPITDYEGNRAYYQWQKSVDGAWADVGGASGAGLVFYAAGSEDAGSYRSRINVVTKAGSRAISTFTDAAEVVYSKRSVTFPDLSAVENADGAVVSVTVDNAHADSGAVPTGRVDFTLTGTGGTNRVPYSVWLDAGGRAEVNISSVPPGAYKVSAHYSGDRVFKSGYATPVFRLLGATSGYWLDVADKATYGDQVPFQVYRVTKGSSGESIAERAPVLRYELTDSGGEAPYAGGTCEPSEDTSFFADAVKTVTLRAYYDDDGVESYLEAPVTIEKRPITVQIPAGSGGVDDPIDWTVMAPQTASGSRSIVETQAGYLADNIDYTFKNAVDVTVTASAVPMTPGLYLVTGIPSISLTTNYDVSILSGSYAVTGPTSGLTASVRPFGGLYTGSLHLISPIQASSSDDTELSGRVPVGTRVSLSAIPQPGYAVYDWYVNGQPQNTRNTWFSHAMLAGDMDIRVQFVVQENTLTFGTAGVTSGGTITCASDPSFSSGNIVRRGAEMTFTATPKSGYDFKEWRYTVAGSGTTYPPGTPQGPSNSYKLVMPGAKASLYAAFERKSFGITLTENLEAVYWGDHDGDATTPMQEITLASGSRVRGDTQITVQPKTGYHVNDGAAWLSIGSQGTPGPGNNSYSFKITADTRVEMPVHRHTYRVRLGFASGTPSSGSLITYSIDDAGTAGDKSGQVTPSGANVTVPGGATLRVGVSPAFANRFVSWVRTGSSSAAVLGESEVDLGAIGEDCTLTVTLEAKPTHTVTLGPLADDAASYRYSVNGGAYAPAAPGSLPAIIDGSSLSVRVMEPPGAMVGWWTVDGVDVPASGNTYTFESVKKSYDIAPILISTTYCTVSWPGISTAGNGIAITPHGGHLPIVRSGSEFSFTITTDRQIDGVFATGADGAVTELTEDSGVYTIAAITTNQVITIATPRYGITVDGTDVSQVKGSGWRYDYAAGVLTLSTSGHTVTGAMVDPGAKMTLVLDDGVSSVTFDDFTMTAEGTQTAVASLRPEGVEVTLVGDSRVEMQPGDSTVTPRQIVDARGVTFTPRSTGSLSLVASFPEVDGHPTSLDGLLADSITLAGGKLNVTISNMYGTPGYSVTGVSVGSAADGLRVTGGELDIDVEAGVGGDAQGIDAAESTVEFAGGRTRATARALAPGRYAEGVYASSVDISAGVVELAAFAPNSSGVSTGLLVNTGGVLEVAAAASQPGATVYPKPIDGLTSANWTVGAGMTAIQSSSRGMPMTLITNRQTYLTSLASGFANSGNRYLQVCANGGSIAPASVRVATDSDTGRRFAITSPRSGTTLSDFSAIVMSGHGSVLGASGVVLQGGVDSPHYLTLNPEYLSGLGVGRHTLTVSFMNGETATATVDVIPGPRTPQATIGLTADSTTAYKGRTFEFDATLSNMTAIDDTTLSWVLTGAASGGTRLVPSADGMSATLEVATTETSPEIHVYAYLAAHDTLRSPTLTLPVANSADHVLVAPTDVTLRPLVAGGNTKQFSTQVHGLNGGSVDSRVTWSVWGNRRLATRISSTGLLTVDAADLGYNGLLKVTATSVTNPAASATTNVYLRFDLPVALTMSVPSALGYGESATISGKLTDSKGVPLGGRQLVIEAKAFDATAWRPMRTTVTNASGGYSFSDAPAVTTTYRATWAGDYRYAAASASKAITPKAWMGDPVAPSTAKHGVAFKTYGYLKPKHAAGDYPVRIYKERKVSGRWKSYGYVKAKASDYSSYTKYSASVRLPYAGSWRLRAYHADSGHGQTWSGKYDYVKVK